MRCTVVLLHNSTLTQYDFTDLLRYDAKHSIGISYQRDASDYTNSYFDKYLFQQDKFLVIATIWNYN